MIEPFPIEKIADTMLKLERRFHPAGWDNDQLPIVASLDRIDNFKMAITSTPLRPTMDHPIGMWLMGMAREIAENPEIGSSLANQLLPELYGFAFITENWASNTPRAEMKPGQGHADMPDGQELRTITAVDRHGRVIYVQRIRKQEPIVWHSEFTPEQRNTVDLKEVVGGVPEGLRRLLLAILSYRDGETEESLKELSSIQLLRRSR